MVLKELSFMFPPEMITHSKDSAKLKNWVFASPGKFWVEIGLFLILAILVYHSVMLQLWLSWFNNHYYSHGLIIPAISLYILFRSRRKLLSLKIEPCPYGIVIIIFGISILLLTRNYAGPLFFSAISMLIFLMGGVLFIFGKECLRVLLFPILYLLFMIPIPDFVFNSLIGPLQLTAAKLGEFVLQVLGLPVYRQGIYLSLAPITIEVDKSCSAMHSLIALSALSVIVAYFWVDSFKKRVIIVASSIPLAILANGFRLVLIILLVLWKGEKVLDSFLHPLSGKLFFLGALSILVLEASMLKRFGRLRFKDLFINWRAHAKGGVGSRE